MKANVIKTTFVFTILVLAISSCDTNDISPDVNRQRLPIEGSWIASHIDHDASGTEVTDLFAGFELMISKYDAEIKCPKIGAYCINDEWQHFNDRYIGHFSNKGDRDEFILEVLSPNIHNNYPLTVIMKKEVKGFEDLPANYSTGTYTLYLDRNDD